MKPLSRQHFLSDFSGHSKEKAPDTFDQHICLLFIYKNLSTALYH